MEIKVDDIQEEFEGKIIGFDKDGNLVVQINGSDHLIKVLEMKSDKFEFLFLIIEPAPVIWNILDVSGF